jgi:hypothetical protein
MTLVQSRRHFLSCMSLAIAAGLTGLSDQWPAPSLLREESFTKVR